MTVNLEARGLSKSFVLHAQGGIRLPVLCDFGLTVAAGECVALRGPSGAGKSTVLRLLYGNYRADSGTLRVAHGDGMVDLATAPPRLILAVRRQSIGHVSQFLRAVPRVPAEEVVAEPVRRCGVPTAEALDRARRLMARLNLPERLWRLAPATFSGGEQQRVNLARGLVAGHRTLLLDEPTAALDATNRAVVVDLIREVRAAGTAVVGIFHDQSVRHAVADRVVALAPFAETQGSAGSAPALG